MGILTTVVGSYPVPDWLAAYPSEQSLLDAMAVILKTQENAGIDVIADGELGRFDVNHPETNGMIEYFVDLGTGKVRLIVNLHTMREAGIILSARLLALEAVTVLDEREDA